jgi:beta-lactamase superfamily II metal-dependent hydrolase
MAKKPANKKPKALKKKAARKKAAKRKTTKNAAKKSATASHRSPTAPDLPLSRLFPPPSCVTVRMYRIGHGDCFLLAFATDDPNKPAYVLIDCGYKPGSQAFINTNAKEIGQHIVAATGGHVQVAVITHEHQDHVNAISTTNFAGLSIGEAWFAWTEDPEDDLANDLRKKFKDDLIGLVAARNQLAAAGDAELAERLDDFLAFELGGDDEYDFNAMQAETMLGAIRGDPSVSANKKSMKLFKDLAKDVRYLHPHEEIMALPNAQDVRVYVLGPPKDVALLKTLDPEGSEEFRSLAMSNSSAGNYFSAAAKGDRDGGGKSPFASRFAVPIRKAARDREHGAFFKQHYGSDNIAASRAGYGDDEADDNAEWRRIDKEWLYSAEQLALDMNNQTNNSSLVLAFELGKGGKVMLFAADAQRGNWLSWAQKGWKDGSQTVTTNDLLARTVLYKAGHHCSHNASLNGQTADTYANLSWMARGDFGREFTSMITAVRAWAETQKGWDHPFKAIKDTLLHKASGRVFQTDTDFDKMSMAPNGSQKEWQDFAARSHGERLFFDYTIKV